MLKIMQPEELEDLPMNGEMRRRIMFALEAYYALHVPEFGAMRSLPILREVLS